MLVWTLCVMGVVLYLLAGFLLAAKCFIPVLEYFAVGALALDYWSLVLFWPLILLIFVLVLILLVLSFALTIAKMVIALAIRTVKDLFMP